MSSLHRPNSSSTAKFPRLSLTANCLLWTNTTYRLSLYRLGTDPTENTACTVEVCLPSRFLVIEVYYCGADHIENNSTVLLTACVCWSVYRAVAWQCFDEIHIVVWLRVTIYGVWIDNWIYWTVYCSLQHFIVHYYTHTLVSSAHYNLH
jgi:hypothetical protein